MPSGASIFIFQNKVFLLFHIKHTYTVCKCQNCHPAVTSSLWRYKEYIFNWRDCFDSTLNRGKDKSLLNCMHESLQKSFSRTGRLLSTGFLRKLQRFHLSPMEPYCLFPIILPCFKHSNGSASALTILNLWLHSVLTFQHMTLVSI